ncbi:glycosyltransferase family 1 protein [Telmatospirillum sp.]|uniref:glycosyltransferase family 4 protein n=1 Tax=Telmatospirillum sp. TaxID=2079197 RepID=UPI00283E7E10|nr:glycosyltransferase family 1 protein [Telmatospirillum sp.]MDR3441146.1 glycosyltransferase family 1 protein [Telmatospirillum sp.]
MNELTTVRQTQLTTEAVAEVAKLAAQVRQRDEQIRILNERLACEIEAGRATSTLLRQRELLLEATYRSRSWRVTAPLRALSGVVAPRRAIPPVSVPPPAVVPTRKVAGPTIFIECTHTYHSELNTGIQRVVRNILRHGSDVGAQFHYQVVPVIMENDRFRYADVDHVLADKLRAAAEPPPVVSPAVVSPEEPPPAAVEDAPPPPPLRHQLLRAVRPVWRLVLKILATLLPFEGARRFLFAPPGCFGLAYCLLWPLFVLLGRKPSPPSPPPPPPEPALPVVPEGPTTLDDFADLHGSILLLLDSSWTLPLWPAVERFKARGGQVAGVIYDLIPITHSKTCVPELTKAFTEWVRAHLSHTEAFVCISRSVANQLEEFIENDPFSRSVANGVPIDHFHLGSELDFIDPKDEVRPFIGAIFEKKTPVFMMVGSIEPRKNHAYVLDAFDRLWAAGGTASLVIIGRYGWKTEDFLSRVARHEQYGKQLHLLRDATDAELDHAYRNASALVIASEIEGFGLPVVEAFQRGLPVMCSDIPVFREIADGKATFFDLADAGYLTDALQDFCRGNDESTRRVRTPQSWIGWRQSTEQLLGAVTRTLEKARETSSSKMSR